MRKACATIPLYVGVLPGPAAVFASIDARHIEARRVHILTALLGIHYSPLVIAVLVNQPMLAGTYFSELLKQVRLGLPHTIATAFYFVKAPTGDPRCSVLVPGSDSQPTVPVVNELREAVRRFVIRSANPRVVTSATSLIATLGPPWVDEWHTLLGERKRGWLSRRRK